MTFMVNMLLINPLSTDLSNVQITAAALVQTHHLFLQTQIYKHSMWIYKSAQ